MSNENKIDTGGSAFPKLKDDTFSTNYGGMSLRDWFAGQALIGIIAHSEGKGGYWIGAADDAYKAADAMIARRGKK